MMLHSTKMRGFNSREDVHEVALIAHKGDYVEYIGGFTGYK